MTERLLRIRIRPVGAETVTRAVRGITQSAQRAARDQMRSDQQVTREAQRSLASRQRAAQQFFTNAARAQARAASEQARSAQQAARAEQTAAAQTTRMLAREQRLRTRAAAQSQREQQRQARTMMARVGAVGGAVYGAGRAIMGRVSGYQSALGMPTRDELAGSFLDRQRQTIRLAHQSGVSSADITSRVTETSRRSGVSQGDLLNGLQYAQETLATPDFNAMEVFSQHLGEIADASYATGTPVEDLIGALGQMRNQFGITEGDFSEMIGAMVSMANDGSIEVGDLAANFTREMAQFRGLRAGVTGTTAAREFAGTAEVIGRSLPNAPEEAATQFRAVMTELGRGGHQRALESAMRRGGLSREQSDVFNQAGEMTVTMPELISRMRTAHLDTGGALDRIGFTETRAAAGFRTLMHEDPAAYNTLINSSADAGNRMIQETNTELRGSLAGRADQARVNAEANFQENGASTVEVMLEMANAVTTLQTRFPAATEAMGAMADILGTMGASSIVGSVGTSLIGGGGIGSILGTGGAAAGAGATGTSALAAAGTAAAFLGPLAAFLGPTLWANSAGEETGKTGADTAHLAGGGLTAAARDELIRQRQGMGGAQGAELQRQVAAAAGQGRLLTPADIRELSEATGRAVAAHAAEPPAPSALTSSPDSRRVPAERR